ncbi:hypothetical protein [Pseudomonas sp. USHLN015]|uniref:hypothetical protein n=1 Tax=Pseudomonas sp. USHLN015 TaxID=3081296 RepID=UPI00301C53AD
MSLKFSTGLRRALLAVAPLRTALNGCELRIYSGPEPASVDSAIASSNQLLLTIKTDTGAGLTWEADAPGGVITKNLVEDWRGTINVAGTAAFFRFVLPADTGEASTSAVRIQGNVAIAGADLNFSSTAFVVGAVQRLEAYAIALPEF